MIPLTVLCPSIQQTGNHDFGVRFCATSRSSGSVRSPLHHNVISLGGGILQLWNVNCCLRQSTLRAAVHPLAPHPGSFFFTLLFSLLLVSELISFKQGSYLSPVINVLTGIPGTVLHRARCHRRREVDQLSGQFAGRSRQIEINCT